MYEFDQDIDWSTLTTSICHSDCILMIGPDAIMETTDGQSVSIMKLFSNVLIDRLRPDDVSKFEYLNPAQVAQVFKNHEASIWSLRSAAEDFFDKQVSSTTPLLRALATLPFRLIIDTTPTKQMERAFIDAGKKPIDDYYLKKGSYREVEQFDADNPLIYHIFGSVEDLQSLVLTESDFVDLIVHVISSNPALPTRLLNAFNSECSMLFLGFGVRHLSLRILLHILNSGRSTPRSFALERFDDAIGQRTFEGFKLLFSRGQRIDFIDMKLDAFTEQLCSHCRKRLNTHSTSTECVEKASKRPLVFISYRRKDESSARGIKQVFEDRGIDVWLDKDSLEAGEKWEESIKKVIARADCFLLLLSEALYKTYDSVVLEEFRFAISLIPRKRGIFFRPVSIDNYPPEKDNEIYSEVKPYNIFEVDTNAAIEKLARHIKQQHQEKMKTIK